MTGKTKIIFPTAIYGITHVTQSVPTLILYWPLLMLVIGKVEIFWRIKYLSTTEEFLLK